MKRKGNGKGAPLRAETVPLAKLKPHPRNYRQHPEEQLAHIVASIKLHGFYRNIVTARDLTILAGHGVAKAAALAGQTEVPVVRLPLDADDPRALKLLAGDNEVGRLAETDDRVLTDMLRELAQSDGGLLGTGFDETMLAGLVMVTRTEQELSDLDAAAEWVGMPEFGREPVLKLIISFRDEAARGDVMKRLGISAVGLKNRKVWGLFWPPHGKEDLKSVRFEQQGKK